MFKFCFHKWGNWSQPYNTEATRSRGNFGGTSKDEIVMQERKCSKCNKVTTRYLRDGKLESP